LTAKHLPQPDTAQPDYQTQQGIGETLGACSEGGVWPANDGEGDGEEG